MTMNINFTSTSSVTATPGTQESKNVATDKQLAQLPQDRATVSTVGDMVKAALAQPDVRADKVSALREAIASGTYKVDPHAIASSMLADQF